MDRTCTPLTLIGTLKKMFATFPRIPSCVTQNLKWIINLCLASQEYISLELQSSNNICLI